MVCVIAVVYESGDPGYPIIGPMFGLHDYYDCIHEY